VIDIGLPQRLCTCTTVQCLRPVSRHAAQEVANDMDGICHVIRCVSYLLKDLFYHVNTHVIVDFMDFTIIFDFIHPHL